MKKIALLAALALLAVLAVVPIVRNTEREALNSEVRAGAPGQFIPLSQGAVHYEIAGPEGARPVVLVHGFSVPSYVWDHTFEALASEGFRVIRYDLYGRGYSDRPDLTYDRALFVGQLGELLDSLRIAGPVDVVGLSMGGAITAAFAADHPERIRRLAFIAPVNSARDVAPLNWPGVGEYLSRAYYLPSLAANQTEDFIEPERFPEWPEKFTEQMRYRGFGSAILSTVRNYIARDHLPDFRAVGARHPSALLIWGDADRSVPFEQSAGVREALGDPEFFAVPGAGHMLHYEHPERVNPRLIEFLRRP